MNTVGFTVILVSTLVVAGFIVNADLFTVPLDDHECKAPVSSVDERPNGCYHHCEAHPVWWWVGADKDCYWDDEPTADGGK